jgi:hypothetical protein
MSTGWSPAPDGSGEDPSPKLEEFEAANSSSHRCFDRLATLLLPVANHLCDARRFSSPGGRCFCTVPSLRSPLAGQFTVRSRKLTNEGVLKSG